MQWTRLKSQLESRLAKSVRGRVALHQARYRHVREEVGRVWLAVDGREVAAFATHQWQRVPRAADQLMGERRAWGSTAAYSQATAEAEATLHAAGEFTDSVALADLEAYLSLDAEATLASTSPLLRALAMLNARVGKRRLTALALKLDPHPLVRAMHALRCEAEGIRLVEAAAPG